MARNRERNLTAAIRAPFLTSQVVTDQLKQGFDLTETIGFSRRVRSSDNTHDILTLGVSTVGDKIHFGQESILPMQQSISFSIEANGSIATTPFFTADRAYFIQGVSYSHKTLVTGTLAAVRVTHDTGTQAPGAGTSIITTDFNPAGTNVVVQNGAMNGEINYAGDPVLMLPVGDRLSFKLGAGTLTAYAGIVVTVYLTPACTTEVAKYAVHLNADIATQTFFVANRDFTITGVSLIYGTAFAAAVTVDVTQETTTGAPGAGTSVLSAVMAGDGAANTLIAGGLSATAANLYVPAGNRLSVKFSATTTGADVLLVVAFAPVYKRKEVTWQLALNAQQQVAQSFFVADRDYEVIDGSETHGTAAGGVATLNITIDKGTTAPGSGNLVFTDGSSAGFNLNATANTVQVGTLNTLRNRLLSAGDRLSTKPAGAAQATAKTAVTLSLAPR